MCGESRQAARRQGDVGKTRTAVRICFLALNGYPALAGGAGVSHIGGAERQMVLLARELARRGHLVSFITLAHAAGQLPEVGGIRVLTAYAAREGLPGVRFLHPRLTGLWRAMRQADADVYYQRMAEQTTGLAAAFCRRHAKRLIFASASDYDCLAELPRLRKWRERRLYVWGLRRADCVLAQTRRQQLLLGEGFGVQAQVVPNAAEDLALRDAGARGSSEAGPGATTPDEGRLDDTRVLWVGRFTPEKRLDWAMQVARACPELKFDIIGDDPQPGGWDAARLANVRFLGRVPHERIGAAYASAGALLCTSEREGFPNTFLEAWCFGVPVVTTFDPDHVVREHGLGVVAEDVAGLARGLRTMAASRPWRWEIGKRCRRHFEQAYRVERVVDQLEEIIKHLVQRTPAGRG